MKIVGVLIAALLAVGFARWAAAEDEPVALDLAAAQAALDALFNAAPENVPTADELGDPRRWEIRGATTFTAEEIAQALADDIDVAYASRPIPRLDVDGLMTELRAKVAAGYQEHGFPDVKVQVEPDQSGKIVISIAEGQCFTAGEVRVSGTKTIDAARLAQELTPAPDSPRRAGEADGPRPKTTKQGVCWPTGYGTRSVPTAKELIDFGVRRGVREGGWLQEV